MSNSESETKNIRRRRTPSLQTETLETRQLLTAGAGNNFAILPSSINSANVPVSIPFTVAPSLITKARGNISLGIDVAQKNASTVKPLIFKITDDAGRPVAFSRAIYNPHVQRTQIIDGNITTSVIANFKAPRNALSPAHSYKVDIVGQGNTTGQFLVGFYLPGDAKGTGVVDKSSIKAVKGALGSMAGDAKYDFAADANRDGVISVSDLRIAQRNLGAKTTITPVISADLSAASDTGLQDRVTTLKEATFTGTATPNSTVSFEEINAKNPTATTVTSPTGTYSINVKLADGSNQFKVTTVDAFGQTITGQIAPVTSSANALPAATGVPKA